MVVSKFSQGATNSSNTLTDGQKLEIRSYILRVVTPSATVLAILSGLAGFFINKVGVDEGFQQGYSQAFTALFDLTNKTATANSNAQNALDEIAVEKVAIDKYLKEIDAARAKVSVLASGDTSAIADTLLADKVFIGKLASAGSIELKSLQEQVAGLQKTIIPLVTPPPPPRVGPHGSGSDCAPGTYMSGIAFSSAAGGSHGYLDAASIKCQKLSLSQ